MRKKTLILLAGDGTGPWPESRRRTFAIQLPVTILLLL